MLMNGAEEFLEWCNSAVDVCFLLKAVVIWYKCIGNINAIGIFGIDSISGKECYDIFFS